MFVFNLLTAYVGVLAKHRPTENEIRIAFKKPQTVPFIIETNAVFNPAIIITQNQSSLTALTYLTGLAQKADGDD